MSEKITKAITVSGKVQGGWYRKSVTEKADQLNVKETVQNLANGEVLILASGKPHELSTLEQWCWSGPDEAAVSNVQPSKVQTATFHDFKVIDQHN